MKMSRRQLAGAGAIGLGVSCLLRGTPAFAEAADDAAVGRAVEALRKALMEKDKSQLERLGA